MATMQVTVPIWLWAVVTILSTSLAAVIGVGGVLISQGMANNREKEQRAHQTELKEKELAAMRQQRLRDERTKAYADLARLAFTYQSDRPYQSENPADIKEVLGAYSVVEVLAGSPETRDEAKQLFDRVREVREAGNKAKWHTEGGRTTTDDQGYHDAVAAVNAAWKNF